jgi:hypothetical protein
VFHTLSFHSVESYSTKKDLKHESLSGRQNKNYDSLVKLNATLTKLKRDLIIMQSKMKNLETSTQNAKILSNGQKQLRIETAKSPVHQTVTANRPQQLQHIGHSPPSSQEIDHPSLDISKYQNTHQKAVIFTMDCIPSYEENSRHGGAAGELIIRHALESAFKAFNIPLTIIRSDAQFDTCNMNDYTIILLDPWTWAMKGWKPKMVIRGHERKIFILDFFGSPNIHNNALNIDPRHRILTAFRSPWNTFLGYYLDERKLQPYSSIKGNKLAQGVIWGKDPKHFHNKQSLITKVADKVTLIATSSEKVFQHSKIHWKGHLQVDEWFQLLSQSKFLLGLGNPLLGPSALDAIALGCMFIEPIYSESIKHYTSQHPFVKEVAPEYVCSYHESNLEELFACIDQALSVTLPPKIPKELTKDEYLKRIVKIFLS